MLPALAALPVDMLLALASMLGEVLTVFSAAFVEMFSACDGVLPGRFTAHAIVMSDSSMDEEIAPMRNRFIGFIIIKLVVL